MLYPFLLLYSYLTQDHTRCTCIIFSRIIFSKIYKKFSFSIEDEVVCYTSRGLLIDALAGLYPTNVFSETVSKYADWKSLDATYWEDIDGTREWNDRHRLMYLKYCSNYLQTIEWVLFLITFSSITKAIKIQVQYYSNSGLVFSFISLMFKLQ